MLYCVVLLLYYYGDDERAADVRQAYLVALLAVLD